MIFRSDQMGPDWKVSCPSAQLCGQTSCPLFPLAGPHGQVLYIPAICWVAVKELKISYHNKETQLFTMYTSYGNLASIPYQQPSLMPDTAIGFLLGWPQNTLKNISNYIGSLIKAIRENIKYPRGLPSL